MAASITGVFTIIDRASGPMRKMETQAIKTMAAIEGVGTASDKMGGSSNKTTAALQREDTNLKNVERSARNADNAVGNFDRSNRRSSDGSSRLSTSLIRLSGVLGFFGRALSALKIPVLTSGIVALAQAIGVAAGGLVALVPNLVTAAGAIGALPQVLSAAAQGFGTVLIAMGGVSQALQAGISMQQQSGLSAMQMANQHRQSAEQIRAASNGITTAQLGVRNAEWALTDAQNQQQLAQRALTDARIEAVRQMQDMRLAEEGAILGQRRAALQLRQAQFTLSQAALDPTQTALDMQSNQLSVQEARLNLHQQRVQRVRATQDLTLAQHRGGARGSTALIQAQQGVVQSNHAIVQSNDAVRQSMFDQRSASLAMRDALIQQRQQTRLGSSAQQQFNLAMKNLGPAAQQFVHFLMGARDRLLQLRQAAGSQLFPALESGFTNLFKLQPTLTKIFAQTGGVIGQAFDRITKSMTTTKRIADFSKLGESNDRLLSMMGRGVNNLGNALVDLMIAARPFTQWLGRTVLGWTKWIRQLMSAGRQTGDLRTKFDHVRTVLEQFGRIISNVWGTLTSLLDAAQPLGQKLWDGAEKATQGWDDFMNSAKGAQEARQWFNDLYAPLHQLGQLIGDLAQAWAQLTITGQFTETIRTLREGVPYILRFMQGTSNLGPQVAQLLVQIVRLLSNLPFGPLGIFLNILNKILSAFNWMLEHIPGLSTVIAAALTVGGITRMVGALGGLIGKWLGVAGAAGKAAQAQEAATVAGMGGVAGPGGVMLPTGARTLPTGVLGQSVVKDAEGNIISMGAGAMAARPGILGNVRSTFAAGREVGMTRLASAGTALRAGGATALDAVGGTAGLLAIPAATGLAIGGMVNTQIDPNSSVLSRAGRVAQGALSGVTLGLIHAPASTADRFATGQQEGQDFIQNGAQYVAVQKQIRDLKRQAGDADMFDLAQINGQLDVLKQARGQLAPQRTTNMLNQFFGGQDPATAFGQMLDAAKKGGGGIVRQMGSVQQQVGSELGKIPRSGRQQFIELYQAWLNQQAKNHPQIARHEHSFLVNLANRYGTLGRDVKIVNGHIVTNSRQMWSELADKAKTGTEKVKEKTHKGLTETQKEIAAILALQTGSKFMADSLVKAVESGKLTMNQARHFGQGQLPGPLTPNMLTPAMRRFAGVGGGGGGGGGRSGPNVLNQGTPFAFKNPLKQRKDQGDSILDQTNKSWSQKANQTRDNINKANADTATNTDKSMKALNKSVNDNTTAARKSATSNFDTTQNQLKTNNQAIFQITDNNWSGVNKTISDNTKNAKQTATDNFNQLQQEALRQLQSMGFSAQQAQSALAGKTGGGGANSARQVGGGHGPQARAAKGMRIPGTGLRDTVLAAPGHLAAPGELIVNRHTERRVDSVLNRMGTSLDAQVKGETRPHYASFAQGGRVDSGGLRFPFRNFQWGRVDMGVDFTGTGPIGAIGPGTVLRTGAPGWPNGGAGPAGQGVLYRLAGGAPKGYGESSDIIYVYEGVKPIVHPGEKLRAGQPIANFYPGSSIETGFANSAGAPLDAGSYVEGTPMPAGHAMFSFLHALAGGKGVLGGASGAAAMQQLHLKLPPKAKGGVPAALVNRATANFAKAMEAHFGGGGGRPMTGPATVKGKVSWFSGGTMASGLNTDTTPGIAMNINPGTDAGWDNPTTRGWLARRQKFLVKIAGHQAVLPVTDLGPAGSTGRAIDVDLAGVRKMGFDPAQFPTDAVGTAQIIKNALGGRVADWGGWHANGFDGVVRRPTVFGVGEGGGPEHVSITPGSGGTTARGPGGGGGGINVRIDKIEWRREGDVHEAIQKEFQLLADNIDYTGNQG